MLSFLARGIVRMTTLEFAEAAPRHFLARLLDRADLAEVVPSLDPQVLYRLVRHCGLEACGEIVALATPQQLTTIFDDDLWRSDLPGQEDLLDADRFALWLEVLAEAGDGVAAQKLAAMDFDLVASAVSAQVFVVDQESMMDVQAAEEYDYDLLCAALHQRGLEERESCELGGYTIVAKRGESWDALLCLLTSLAHDHPVYFGRLMARCCEISTEWVIDNGGLFDVLSSGEQATADAAAAREARREQQGHVAPQQAAGFLKLARMRQEMDLPAPGDLAGSLHSLLPAGEAGKFSRIRGQLLFAQEHDSDASSRHSEQLVYLANVLVAGCSLQSRRFRGDEAADAVLAVCNLGLEHCGSATLPADFLVHHDLMAVFRTGWRVLYEDVCLYSAQRLLDTLSDLRCDDRGIQGMIVELAQRIRTQLAAGTPWLERDNLSVIAILDPPAWATMVNLIDEFPVIPRNACIPSERPALRVTMEWEFISEYRHVRWARDFAASLAEKLL